MDNSIYTQPNTTLLKEKALYCFLLRSKKPKAEPFIDWVVETVLHERFKNLPQPLKKKIIKYRSLSLQMRPINRKF